MHLAGNMLYLWIYGDNVEHRLGPLPFLFWYILTGIAATLFHARWARRLPAISSTAASTASNISTVWPMPPSTASRIFRRR